MDILGENLAYEALQARARRSFVELGNEKLS
jgi:hypothetical protein